MKNVFTEAMDKILKMVVKHQPYLQAHPKELALLMSEYDEIHYASRVHPKEEIHDWNNPKYAVIDLEEVVDKKYAYLVYDAWCASLSDEESSGHELEHKPNKTMDDYFSMCLDPEYKYHSIYPNKKSVLNHILCVIGNGYDWNSKGFIVSSHGPSGTEMDVFYGFKKETFSPKILKECDWLKDKEIINCRTKFVKQVKDSKDKKEKEYKILLDFLKDDPEFEKKEKERQKEQESSPFYPLSKEYSLLCCIPDNAHPSYLIAAKEVCELIIANPKETKANQEIAKALCKKHKF